MFRFAPLLLVGMAIITIFALSACGFRPVYGNYSGGKAAEGNSANTMMGQITIANIPDRSGQFLRNALIDRLHANGEPDSALYTLKIEPLVETKKELDITKSSEATRAQLRIKTHMVLVDKNGNHFVSRDLSSMSSYNVLESEFATRVTENAARENAINDIARQVERNLALYFNRE